MRPPSTQFAGGLRTVNEEVHAALLVLSVDLSVEEILNARMAGEHLYSVWCR